MVETAGVEPTDSFNAITPMFSGVYSCYLNCLTTFDKNYVAGARCFL